MMFKRWKYRVRDCKTRMVGYYDSLEEVLTIFPMSPSLQEMLREGISISDGVQYKVDVRGAYYDNIWELK